MAYSTLSSYLLSFSYLYSLIVKSFFPCVSYEKRKKFYQVHNNFDIISLFCFGGMPNDIQGLLLALYLVITPGSIRDCLISWGSCPVGHKLDKRLVHVLSRQIAQRFVNVLFLNDLLLYRLLFSIILSMHANKKPNLQFYWSTKFLNLFYILKYHP